MVKSRLTKQKEFLNEQLKDLGSFFTADDLHGKAKSKDIGIATVYRFLNILVKEGKIHSYSCNRKTIYSTNKKNHCHFVCELCNSVKHIDLRKVDFLHKEVKGKICHFQVNITGICEKCQKFIENKVPNS